MRIKILLVSVVAALALGGCEVPNPGPGQTLPPGYQTGLTPQVSNVAYGTHPLQKFDFYYLPQFQQVRRPTILWLHSGGWTSGDKANIPEFIKRQVHRGYTLVSANYRLAPGDRFPANIHDVKRAVRFLRAYSEYFRMVDPNMIIVAGGSAGGHLAALAGTSAGISDLEPQLGPDLAGVSSRPNAALVIVAPVEFPNWWGTSHPSIQGWVASLLHTLMPCQGLPPADEQACLHYWLYQASPIKHLRASDPPAYFIYGEQDLLAPPATQGRPLAQAWAQAKGDTLASWFDEVNGLGHNPDNGLHLHSMELWLNLVAARKIN